MKRIAFAVVILLTQVVFRLGAVDAHSSVLVAQPLSAWSWWLGPLAILVRLAAFVVVPVLLGSVLLERAFAGLRRAWRRCYSAALPCNESANTRAS